MLEQLHRIFVLLLVLAALPLGAAANTAGLDQAMYADGKYAVSLAVVGVMLLVIIAYLAWLDRKIRRMEKEENNTK